jgi:hypothetical protein
MLGYGCQNMDGQLIGVRIIDGDEFNSGFHQRGDEGKVSGQSVELGNDQLCSVLAAATMSVATVPNTPSTHRRGTLNMRDQLKAAEPYLIGIGVPAVLAILVFGWGSLFALRGDVSELKGIQAEMKEGLKNQIESAKQEVVREVGQVRLLVVTRADELQKQLTPVVQRVKDIEADPSHLLLQAGIKVDSNFTVAWVEGTALFFPKTADAERKLVQAGYKKMRVNPAVEGYTAPTPAAQPVSGQRPNQ